jgi:hypothetical protein
VKLIEMVTRVTTKMHQLRFVTIRIFDLAHSMPHAPVGLLAHPDPAQPDVGAGFQAQPAIHLYFAVKAQILRKEPGVNFHAQAHIST